MRDTRRCGLTLIELLVAIALSCAASATWGAEPWRFPPAAGRPLLAYSSDAIKPALDEAVAAYQRQTGVEVKVTYCKLKESFERAKRESGDLFLSGHEGAYESAAKEGLAVEGSRRVIGYLRVAIAVPKGNPRGIASLADLAKPGLRVGLGDPDKSQVGRASEDVLAQAGMTEAVHANVVARGGCCSEVAALLTSGQVEAALGWVSFAKWAPDRIETIPLPRDLAKPLPVTALVLATTKRPEAAATFLAFLRGPQGRRIFARYSYSRNP